LTLTLLVNVTLHHSSMVFILFYPFHYTHNSTSRVIRQFLPSCRILNRQW